MATKRLIYIFPTHLPQPRNLHWLHNPTLVRFSCKDHHFRHKSFQVIRFGSQFVFNLSYIHFHFKKLPRLVLKRQINFFGSVHKLDRDQTLCLTQFFDLAYYCCCYCCCSIHRTLPPMTFSLFYIRLNMINSLSNQHFAHFS